MADFPGRSDLAYYVTSLNRFSFAPQVGHIDLFRRIFGYLKKYPKRGYEIKLQPPTINSGYEKFQIKYYLGNQYAYFSEEIDEQFPEPLPDELEIQVFVD